MQHEVTAVRNTPLSTGIFLDEYDEDEADGVWPFRELVGSLMWLAHQSRPDILNAVRALSRFAQNPKRNHWMATSNYGITCKRGSGLELVVYTDAAYAPKETKRKYVSGGGEMCERCGHPTDFQNTEVDHSLFERGRVRCNGR